MNQSITRIESETVQAMLAGYLSKWTKQFPRGLSADGIEFEEREKNYINSQLSRYVQTLKMIPKSPKKLKVLDIGIAFGHLAILIKKLFGYEIFGIDIERTETCHWKERFRKEGISFKPCDLTKDSIPFKDDFFDLVLFCEVLEHLPIFPRTVLGEIRRVLKKHQTLILTTPNFASLGARIRLLFGRCPFPISGYLPETGIGHFREYTANECISLLNEEGFGIENLCFRNCYESSYKLPRKILFLLYKIRPSLKNCIMIKARKSISFP